jgi:hypothetical protein
MVGFLACPMASAAKRIPIAANKYFFMIMLFIVTLLKS